MKFDFIIDYIKLQKEFLEECLKSGDFCPNEHSPYTVRRDIKLCDEAIKILEESEHKRALITDVSKHFVKGCIWQNDYDKSIIKIIDSVWIGQKVRMIDGTVFSKIFLSKHYKFIGYAC